METYTYSWSSSPSSHIIMVQAAMSLADQLLLRPCNAERNINIANEDLENHFKVILQ